MKTKEELKALRGEVETLSKKLAELTEDELNQVTGGTQECDAFLAMTNRVPDGSGFIGAPDLPDDCDDPDLAGRNTTVLP